MPPLLEIQDLKLEFGTGSEALRALDGVSLVLEEGQTLCLVGESGCGKSVTALSIAQLLPTPPARYVGGRILVNGHNVLEMDKGSLRRIRGGTVGYIFQEPGASLNPVYRVGEQLIEPLRLHRPAAANEKEMVELLKLVGIPEPELRLRDYPHQLSGGMQQRVMIAMALAAQPKLLIADEPTTALDVTIQAQILELLRDLKHRLGMSILLITHNLGIVGDIADRVAVMYAGQVVEEAPADQLLRRPMHPYTRALMRSVPELGREMGRLEAIAGTVPAVGAFPAGCRFHPRCPVVQPDCSQKAPALIEAEPACHVRCPHWK